MEERYDILGKIGQGGLGAVYRAYDNHLSREVAIKRILPGEASDHESEATRQLTKEAGALSALQHPHIVTIYDVGVDKDGSFVVMELLHGVTVDDVVKKAVFTWADFREFALQTQEALIAAQDMNLVHRDLKPANVMLTWLPSGKFQVKIVDFGLAKFTPKPSLQTIDQKDGIFGTIFFMAPEQFERVELDSRTDMYAIGCVYYYALTGLHPFDGETGPQVMAAHLEHRVFPLQEIRPDLPRWATDWIMWHINRLPEHRPVKARDSLALFIQNDQLGDAAPIPEEAPTPRGRPALNIPGAAAPNTPEIPKPPMTSLLKSIPQPIMPPENFGRANVHTSSQPAIETASILVASPNAPAPAEISTPPANTPPPPVLTVAPAASDNSAAKPKPRLLIPGSMPTETVTVSPAAVPQASVPVASITPQESASQEVPVAITPAAVPPPPVLVSPKAPAPVPTASAAPVIPARPIPTAALAPGSPRTAAMQSPAGSTKSPKAAAAEQAAANPRKKPAMSNSAKAALASILGVIIILVVWLMITRNAQSKINQRYNVLVALAAKEGITSLPVDSKDLQILLDATTGITSKNGRETVYNALYYAESTDGTNIDEKLLAYAVNTPMQEDNRVNLLSRVIGGRIAKGDKTESMASGLMQFINSNPKPESAVAALTAIRSMAADQHLPELLQLLQNTNENSVRKSSEEVIVNLVKKSSSRDTLASKIEPAYQSASAPEVKQATLRLLGATGTPKAQEVILGHLKGTDKIMQIAAADAAKNWPNESLLQPLLGIFDEVKDPMLRSRIFHSCREVLLQESERTDDQTQDLWKLLATAAKLDAEQEAVIGSLVTNSDINEKPWVRAIIKNYEDTASSDRVIDRAGKAIDRLDEIAPVDSKDEK